jgi:hypothetical protein
MFQFCTRQTCSAQHFDSDGEVSLFLVSTADENRLNL